MSIRLNYQYRSDWLDGFRISGDRISITNWESTERLNLSFRYQFRNSVTLYFDANNLTDELGVRYLDSPSRPTEVEGFGRRFLLGVRLTLHAFNSLF